MAEQGFPGFDVTHVVRLHGSGGDAAHRSSTRLRDEAIKAVQRPDVQQVMAAQGLEVETSTPQELAARIRAETQDWAEVIKAAGIKAE